MQGRATVVASHTIAYRRVEVQFSFEGWLCRICIRLIPRADVLLLCSGSLLNDDKQIGTSGGLELLLHKIQMATISSWNPQRLTRHVADLAITIRFNECNA